MKAIIFALVIATAFCNKPWKLEKCASKNELINFTDAELGADPVKGGDNLIVLKGVAKDHFELEVVNLEARLFNIPVQTIKIQNTDIADGGDKYQFQYNANFPSYTPSGQYLVTFQFTDTDGEVVGCAGVQFKLG